MAKKLFINGNKDCIPYSDKMECNYDSKDATLEIYIKFPMENMQDNAADFEAIAFSAWSIKSGLKITLKFDSVDWGGQFPLTNYLNRQNKTEEMSCYQHYMRFLYRACKMKSLYKNFSIHKDNASEVTLFENLFEQAKCDKNLCMTLPESQSEVKKENKLTENHLEKWFVIKTGDDNDTNPVVQKLKSDTNVGQLYDQFPCGLFYDKFPPEEENRIFNRGCFDLWGVDTNNNICLFELKKPSNKNLGIISELFFYSCIFKDFKDPNIEKSYTKLRGFDLFLSANNKVKAYFLVPIFHSFIEKHIDKIIDVMNQRNDDVEYGYVKFDVNDILNDNIFQNLHTEWNVFNN